MKKLFAIILIGIPSSLWADTHAQENPRVINTAYGHVYPTNEKGVKKVAQKVGDRTFFIEYSRTKMGQAPQAKVTHEWVNGKWEPMSKRPKIKKISPIYQNTQDGTLYGFEFEGDQGAAFIKLVTHQGSQIWVSMPKSNLATGEAQANRYRDPTEKEILSLSAKKKADVLEASAHRQLNDPRVKQVIHNNSNAFKKMKDYYGIVARAPSKERLFSTLPFPEHPLAPGARMVSLPIDPKRPTLRITITEEEFKSQIATILGMRAGGDVVDYFVRRNEMLAHIGDLGVDVYRWATGPQPISSMWGKLKHKAENFDPRANNPNLVIVAHVGDGIDDGITQANRRLALLPDVVAANVWLQAQRKNNQDVDSKRFMLRNRNRVKSRKNRRMEKAATSNLKFVQRKYNEKLSEATSQVQKAVRDSERDTAVVLGLRVKEAAFEKAAQLENNAYLLGTDSAHSGFGMDINNSTPRGIALVLPTSDGKVYTLNGIEKRGEDGKHIIPLPITGAYRNAVLRHYNENGKLTRQDLYSISIQYGFFPTEDGQIKYYNPEKRIGSSEMRQSFSKRAKQQGGLTRKDVQEFILATQGIADNN